MGRKYKQEGYQEKGTGRGERRRARHGVSREGPRSPRMPGFYRAVRCAMCGVQLPVDFAEITPSSQCPKCEAFLHSCKHCVYFDPASRFECSQPILERVTGKDSKNNCEFFEVRSTVDKMTGDKRTNTGAQRPSDARDAFEDLFKK
mgnify:FL=1